MTQEQKEFIEWSKPYLRFYTILVERYGKTAIQIIPEKDRLYVLLPHFQFDICLSFNETKFYITSGINWEKNLADDIASIKAAPHSVRFLSVESAISFFDKMDEIETFISKEGE